MSGSLVGHLVGAVNGASIARKTSFLKDRLGEQLFAKNIRIIDDPLRVRGLRSQTFDAEGVKVKKLAIVDEGVLTTWLLDCATARELGLVTTGHAHRGVSSSPSPGPYNLHLEAGEPTPAELISDISQGFYVTDLIGSGVNGVTGDYSRGASGFWIENGEITYAGERGDDRGSSVRDIQVDGAGQRSGIPLRRQCADAAHRGIDAWRTLAPAPWPGRSLARDAALLRETVREAGALALSLFRTELKNWTKGASSPVSEADIAVNDLLESGCDPRRRIMAGCRKKAPTTRARLGKHLVWIVDPIDGTRGYLAGREDWCVSVALVEDASPVLAAVFAPASDEFFFAVRGQGAAAQRCCRFMRRPAPSSIFRASPGRSRWSSGSTARPVKLSCIPESDRWRFGCAGSRREGWMRLLRAAKAATGTLPRPI